MDFKEIEIDNERKIRIHYTTDSKGKKDIQRDTAKIAANKTVIDKYHDNLTNFVTNYDECKLHEADTNLKAIIELHKKYDLPYISEITSYKIVQKCIDYYSRRPNISIASHATHILLFLSALSGEHCEEMAIDGIIQTFESYINEEASILTEPEMMDVLSNMMLEDKLKEYFDDLKIEDVLLFLLDMESTEYILPAARFLRIYSLGGVDEAHSELYLQLIHKLFETNEHECYGYLLYTIIELIKIDQINYEQFFTTPLAEIVASLIEEFEYEVVLIFGLCILKCQESVELAPFGPDLIESFLFEECERDEIWMHKAAARCIYLSGLVLQEVVTDPETLTAWARWVVDGIEVMNMDLKQHSGILLISILKMIPAKELQHFDLPSVFDAFEGFIYILAEPNLEFAVQTFIELMGKLENAELDPNSLAESSGIVDTIRDAIEAKGFESPIFDSFEVLVENNGF